MAIIHLHKIGVVRSFVMNNPIKILMKYINDKDNHYEDEDEEEDEDEICKDWCRSKY